MTNFSLVFGFFVSFIVLSQETSFSPFLKYTAVKDSSGHWSIEVGSGGSAWGEWRDFLPSTGWTILDIVSNPKEADDIQAYAAGFVEGAIIQHLIWNSFRNFANGTSFPVPSKLTDFITANDKWVRSQAANPTENTDYWAQVALVLRQFDGLFDGYNQYAPNDQKISYIQFLLYQLNWEYADIMTALQLNTKGKSLKSGPSDYLDSHCSSLVRVSPDGMNLFSSHVTWTVFSAMLRTYKHYNLSFATSSNKAPASSFSSYPGTLVSGDDWYVTSSNLIVMETTNGVMNTSLFQYVTTKTVMYWIRVIVANRMAASGKDWATYFSLYNSGTYNNQWMIVDNKLFNPGKPIVANTLWIAEQIPGYVISGDESSILGSQGRWISYNIPFFPFVYNISGYPEYYQKYGNEYSYSKCARAQIFARDYSKVAILQDMKHIMRYNKWQTDPLSLGDACRGISARCDLNSPLNTNTLNPYSAFGASDAKLSSNILSPSLESTIVCGPTWDSQPPFAWTDEWSSVPSFGQPRLFNFDWVNVKPNF